MMSINPDMEETFALRGWFDASGNGQTFQAHQRTNGSGAGGGGFNRKEMCTLKQIKDAEVGETAVYFSTRAVIMHIKPETIAYPGCSSPGCSKKVVQDGDAWRCEKCNVAHENPKWRWVFRSYLARGTDSRDA